MLATKLHAKSEKKSRIGYTGAAWGIGRRRILLNSVAIGVDWLALAKSGDRRALGELLRVADPQLRVALKGAIPARLAPIMDLTDLLQVTYLEAALAVRTFDDRGSDSFVAWLLRIARNNLRDALRESKRKKRTPADGKAVFSLNSSAHVHLLEKLCRSSTSPSRIYSKVEADSELHRAIDKLPPDYRAVIERCDLQEQSASQAAEQMHRSVGAIYMLRARALEHLTALIQRDSNPISSAK